MLHLMLSICASILDWYCYSDISIYCNLIVLLTIHWHYLILTYICVVHLFIDDRYWWCWHWFYNLYSFIVVVVTFCWWHLPTFVYHCDYIFDILTHAFTIHFGNLLLLMTSWWWPICCWPLAWCWFCSLMLHSFNPLIVFDLIHYVIYLIVDIYCCYSLTFISIFHWHLPIHIVVILIYFIQYLHSGCIYLCIWYSTLVFIVPCVLFDSGIHYHVGVRKIPMMCWYSGICVIFVGDGITLLHLLFILLLLTHLLWRDIIQCDVVHWYVDYNWCCCPILFVLFDLTIDYCVVILLLLLMMTYFDPIYWHCYWCYLLLICWYGILDHSHFDIPICYCWQLSPHTFDPILFNDCCYFIYGDLTFIVVIHCWRCSIVFCYLLFEMISADLFD